MCVWHVRHGGLAHVHDRETTARGCHTMTHILTVGRSATGVKLKVNGQGLQKLSGHRSSKKITRSRDKTKTLTHNQIKRIFKGIRTYTRLYGTFRLTLCMQLCLRDV